MDNRLKPILYKTCYETLGLKFKKKTEKHFNVFDIKI